MNTFFSQINKAITGCVLTIGTLLLTSNLQAQQQLTNLPTFYLTTQDNQAVSDKVTWIPGNITVVSSDATENLNMPMTIRGRGNSTWSMAKKNYRIKLDSKQQLLNLPAKEKNRVLLANHADKTLIRNALAFIYPNPATDYLHIEQSSQSDLPIGIYRLDGRRVYETRTTYPSFTLNLKKWNIQTGIYVVKIGNSVSKLIVNK